MPLFNDPLLLFIHIPKNAGRSIEKAFLGAGSKADHGRPNIINRFAKYLTTVSRSNSAYTQLIGTQDVTIVAQHLTYSELELLGIGPSNLRSIPSFCVCRNPFDRTISSVTHFMGRQDSAQEFEVALDKWLDHPPTNHNQLAHKRLQYEFIIDSCGRPVIDTVLRFENLASDFTAFAEKIGRKNLSLPWTGRANRERDIHNLLTARAQKAIRERYQEDFEFFKYQSGN